MRTLIIILSLLSTSLFGQKRDFVRNEKIFRFGHLRETNFYTSNDYSEAEITWSDSLTSKVVQYSHTFFDLHSKCIKAECIKYLNVSTRIVIKSNKSGKTVEWTYKYGKRMKKRKLSPNAGCTECYDPVKGIN